MPLLFIIFVIIIGRSLSLPNAMEGRRLLPQT